MLGRLPGAGGNDPAAWISWRERLAHAAWIMGNRRCGSGRCRRAVPAGRPPGRKASCAADARGGRRSTRTRAPGAKGARRTTRAITGSTDATAADRDGFPERHRHSAGVSPDGVLSLVDRGEMLFEARADRISAHPPRIPRVPLPYPKAAFFRTRTARPRDGRPGWRTGTDRVRPASSWLYPSWIRWCLCLPGRACSCRS